MVLAAGACGTAANDPPPADQTSGPGAGATKSPLAEATEAQPSRRPVHKTDDPRSGSVFELEDGLAMGAWGFRSRKTPGENTYEADWGMQLVNTRGGNWVLGYIIRGDILFLDANGKKVAQDQINGAMSTMPGQKGNSGGTVRGMKTEPVKLIVQVPRVKWREDAHKYQNVYKSEVIEPVLVSDSGIRITTKVKVTNLRDKPLDVATRIIYVDKNDAFVLSGFESQVPIEPKQSRIIDVTAWGNRHDVKAVVRPSVRIEVIPRQGVDY